jgi:hypothetical protein
MVNPGTSSVSFPDSQQEWQPNRLTPPLYLLSPLPCCMSHFLPLRWEVLKDPALTSVHFWVPFLFAFSVSARVSHFFPGWVLGSDPSTLPPK